MKLLKRKVSAFLIAACLICMNIVPAFADTTTPDATVPTVADVKKEAQLTASYLMSNADYSNISDTSTFYNASRNLLLSIRSGYDCSKQIEAYLNSVKTLLNSDGTLNVSLAAYGCPNDTFSSYAYLLMVLAVTGNDAADFNGCNIVAAFDNLLANITDSDLTYAYDWTTYAVSGMNPYHIGTFYSAVYSYKDSLTNADKAIAVAKKTLTTLCAGGKGIDYSGTSADNNGISLVPFSTAYSDTDVKAVIDNAIAYVKTLADPDGSTQGQYWNDDYTQSWYASNPDATALALTLFSQYNVNDYAAANYNALIKNYKSAATPGCYTYQGYDSIYSAQDSMIGLVTYEYALEGKSNPFDVSAEVKAIADAKNTPVEEPSTENSTEQSTETATELIIEPVTEASADSASSDDITTPQTGDVNVYMYMLLAAACAVTCGGITVYNRKKAN